MGRIITALGLCLLLTRCAGPPPASGPPPSFQPLNPTPPVALLQPDHRNEAAPPAATLDGSSASAPARTLGLGSSMTFEGVAFDARSHRLAVVDQQDGPGSTHPSAESAARSIRGLTAVNGGFFTPDGSPLGLVVSDGKASGSWNDSSSLGSGVYYQDAAGSMKLVRRHTLTPARAAAMPELLQAGPVLVENHQMVDGLDDTKRSDRTLLLWDGHHRWWIGQSSSCSLKQLATHLVHQPPVGWKIKMALNLDGGSSCDLWISKAIRRGPFTRKSFFSKPARNYLVLVPR